MLIKRQRYVCSMLCELPTMVVPPSFTSDLTLIMHNSVAVFGRSSGLIAFTRSYPQHVNVYSREKHSQEAEYIPLILKCSVDQCFEHAIR